MKSALLIAVMAAVTLLLRALPFLVLRKRTPAFISYLGRVLPPAIIGMLVIYCLKDITPAVRPFGLPELAAAACVVGMQVWRRSALISILSGTAVYMTAYPRIEDESRDWEERHGDRSCQLRQEGKSAFFSAECFSAGRLARHP